MGAIIWLASYPKSGNTWVRAFLHNLLRAPNRPTDINTLDRFTLGDSQKIWYRSVSESAIEGLSAEELLRLTPAVHRKMTESFPDSVFVKTHNYLGQVLGQSLITMTHTAGAIYIIRNPLDVTLSLSNHAGMSIDRTIEFLNNPQATTPQDEVNIEQFYGTWSNHVETWTSAESDRLITVRYEDLAAKPLKTFGGIVRFLGLKPPWERLQRAIKFSSFKVLRAQEEAHGFKERSENAERFFRQGEAGQWRRALTSDQIDRVVSAHEAVMAKFGYLP